MPLSVGDKLGPYEILAPIGKGGMGEVYRAHDDRLNRDVAIKVSNSQFTERFTREARAIAALNHTNICHLYDVGPDYLVMEYVEGQDLSGPLDFEDAYPIIQQLIDGIEAAHEKNIIHRDLKPANIKITPEGVVKILDFGLAKLNSVAVSSGSDPENSPTMSMAATAAGTILGTAAYMSPEQAKGRTADRRSDIWAFGVIVYEMLTGKRLFQGESAVEILGGVLNQDPDISAAPVRVHRLLRWCLEKDRKNRLAAISDARKLLSESNPANAESAAAQSTSLRSRLTWVAWGAAALFLVASVALAFVHFRETPPEPELVTFHIEPPEHLTIVAVRVSPDGRQVAFIALGADSRNQLWIQPLGSLNSKRLGAEEITADALFWSPDSQFIGFATMNRQLKKMEIANDSSQTICDLSAPIRGAAWNEQGDIIFGAANQGLMRVSANGGVPSPLTSRADLSGFAGYHGEPAFLPDGRHFLYVRVAGFASPRKIFIGSLDSTPAQQSNQPLLAEGSDAVYAAESATKPNTGHVLFVREGVLMVRPFDARRLAFTGEAARIAGQVGLHSASSGGVLAYLAGASSNNARLLWRDRQGKIVGEIGSAAGNRDSQLSWDGKRFAVDRIDGHIWTADLPRAVFSRLNTGDSQELAPAISPDGLVAFTSTINGAAGDIYATHTNGSSAPELLVKSTLVMHPNQFSADGRFLIYDVHDLQRRQDLWVVPLFGDRKPIPFLTSDADETSANFSPDGKWIVYSSDESGRRDVYVQGFVPDHSPANGVGKWQISPAGGDKPHWSRNGREIFYISPAGEMMAVPVKTGASFEPGTATRLFEVHTNGYTPFDVSPDGRFLINTPVEDAENTVTPITVVLNWQVAFKK